MELIVEYWSEKHRDVVTETGFRYRSSESVVVSVELYTGTPNEIYTKFYHANERLRYCNGSYFKFKDKEEQIKYISWLTTLPESARFQMMYSGGRIVD